MSALLRIFIPVMVVASLAACAEMPMPVAVRVPQMPAPSVAVDGIAQFIADERAEAGRLDTAASLSEARLHWRYVAALLPNDVEAKSQIARLDGAIRARVDALIAQGEAAVRRNRLPDAQLNFLKALAIDGTNEHARMRLRELDTRAAFLAQDRKDQRASSAARDAGTESPNDEK
jgi:hypothetical protein